MDEDLAVLKPNGGDLVMNLLLRKVEAGGQRRSVKDINLLTVTGQAGISSLNTMNEGRRYFVETVQPLGRLIHICIVLRDKLPGHVGWGDIITRRAASGRSGIRHEVGYILVREVRVGEGFLG